MISTRRTYRVCLWMYIYTSPYNKNARRPSGRRRMGDGRGWAWAWAWGARIHPRAGRVAWRWCTVVQVKVPSGELRVVGFAGLLACWLRVVLCPALLRLRSALRGGTGLRTARELR
jgi:hypothetical protein